MVFAFEADPMMYECLARNLEQFSWAQATHPAVWDHSGTLTFERRDFGKGEHLDVRAILVDDWCRDAHVTRWDAMKLDAEGSELAVLQGAKNALEQFQPFMMIEINGILLDQAGISPKQIVDFLTARNYCLFRISFGPLESWNLAKYGEFSETLCLPEPHAVAALEGLARAGFDLVN